MSNTTDNDLIEVVQELEITDAQGNADPLIELFDIEVSPTQVFHLISGFDDNIENVFFPYGSGNIVTEYWSTPIKIEEISITADGAQNRPSLSLANIMNFARTDEQNNPLYPLDPAETDTAPGVGDEASLKQMLKSLGVNKNEDFLGSKVTYRRAFLSNTKKKEDEGTVAVPKEFPKAKFILDRVASENNIFVSFELASPFDVQGLKIPNRYVIGKYCSWKYQGVALGDPSSGCTYPLNGNYYDIDDNPITTPSAYNNATAYSVGNKVLYDSKIWEAIRPSTGEQPDKSPAYWKRLDVCGKTLSSCKIRFHGTTGMSATQQNNTQIPLPFGGFPGTRKFR